ncbi:MAG TPA: hypothetical protein VEC37_03525 [Bacillota bacterium]|nr:hypothetical protein [Bacillota bacterium]
MDHVGMNMGGSGLATGSFLNGLLVFSFKLLMVILIITLIAGILGWIKSSFLKNGTSQTQPQTKTQNQNILDSIEKTISLGLLAIIGLALVFALFNSGNSHSLQGNVDGFSNAALTVIPLLMLIAKMLLWITLISLIIAAIVYVKNQYDHGNLNFNNSNNTSLTNSQPNNNAIQPDTPDQCPNP